MRRQPISAIWLRYVRLLCSDILIYSFGAIGVIDGKHFDKDRFQCGAQVRLWQREAQRRMRAAPGAGSGSAVRGALQRDLQRRRAERMGE